MERYGVLQFGGIQWLSFRAISSSAYLPVIDDYKNLLSAFLCLMTFSPPRSGRVQPSRVCVSVCLYAYLENHTAELHQICVNVAGSCPGGTVLLRTSGFVDLDVVTSCFTKCVLSWVMFIFVTRQLFHQDLRSL